MMRAIQFKEYGGPDVLKMTDTERPVPTGHEVLIEIDCVGVNYADTARREGQYVVPTPLPFIPGAEVAGVVVEVGGKVTKIKPGTRVVSLIESGGIPKMPCPTSTLSFRSQTPFPFMKLQHCPFKG